MQFPQGRDLLHPFIYVLAEVEKRALLLPASLLKRNLYRCYPGCETGSRKKRKEKYVAIDRRKTYQDNDSYGKIVERAGAILRWR